MRLKHFLSVFLTLLTLSVGQMWGTEYTYTSFTTKFTKGATNGTNINTGISGGNSGTDVSTIASDGASNFASKVTETANCYYNTSGAGIRLAKSGSDGSIKLTLSNALKDSTIYAIVLYASKVSGNTKAVLNVTPTGPAVNGYTTGTNITNGDLPAYDATNYAANTANGLVHYKLDTIKVNGKKIETLTFGSVSKGYTMLHAITIVTQTEKAAPAPSYSITAQSNNTNYGTVLLSGSVITATPAENCRIASTAYDVTSGTATVARGTGANINKFTVTPSSDCTVRINFEQIPTHKISFNTGGLVVIDDATGIKEGDTYNITQTPAASLTNSCEYGTFVGWTTASSIANVSICPSIITSYTMGASDVILHAVYSKTVGGTGAAVGTKMLAETFEDFNLNNYPTAPGTNATAYSSSTQYACNPNSNNGTRIQTSDGPCSTNAKNIIVKSGGSFAISNIPTGAASTLTFKCRVKGSNTLNITSTEANVALGSNTGTAPERVYTLTVSNNATSFGLNFAASGGNMRLDSIDIAVATTVNGGTTTYSLDANCCTSLGSINGSFFWTTHFCPVWPAKHRS